MLLSRPRLSRLVRPMPPTPMPAMFSRSLGATNPLPSTCRGTMVTAAVVAATFVTNLRLEIIGWPLAGDATTIAAPVHADHPQSHRLRRCHRWLGRGRRHGREGADRSRRERPDARSRRDVRHAPRFEDDGVAVPIAEARPADSRAPVRRVRRRLGRLDARR